MQRPHQRIIALAFDTPGLAHEALQSATRLADDELMTIHDAVLVDRSVDGRTHVERAGAPSIAAIVPSLLAGAVVGALVAGPVGFLIGGVLVGVGAALVIKLVASSIPHHVVGELRERTRPGQTVLALLVSDIAGPAVLEELRKFRGARVVYAQLPAESLELVRHVLG